MRRKWAPRSLKQQWVAERLFSHKGSVNGIITRLRQIAHSDSTLPKENKLIYDALFILASLDFEFDKELSWKQFQEKRK